MNSFQKGHLPAEAAAFLLFFNSLRSKTNLLLKITLGFHFVWVNFESQVVHTILAYMRWCDST